VGLCSTLLGLPYLYWNSIMNKLISALVFAVIAVVGTPAFAGAHAAAAPTAAPATAPAATAPAAPAKKDEMKKEEKKVEKK
jgi:ribosomal protein L12E/L44/L45/RPP1/RPP2